MRVICVALFLVVSLHGQSIAADNDKLQPTNGDSKTPDLLTKLKFRPSISFSSGYDSNFDKSSSAEGSAFLRTNAGLEISYEAENGNNFTFDASGRLVELIELEHPERWQYRVGFDGNIGLGDEETQLTFGGEHSYDNTDPPIPIVTNFAYSEVEKINKQYKLTLRGSVEQEFAVSNDPDDTEFDFVKPEIETSVRLNESGKISPYAGLRAAMVQFPRQDIELSLVDRNAKDYSVYAGLRLRPSDDLTINIGGRYNLRQFNTEPLGKYDAAYVDVSIMWEPTKNLTVEGEINRYLEETTSIDSLVNDTKNYSISSTYKVTGKASVGASVEYKISKEVGIDNTRRERIYGLEARYEPTKLIRFFAQLLYGRSEEIDGDGYQRVRVRAGVSAKF